MEEKDIRPYVRFFQRRCHPMPYSHQVCAFDFRMFCVKDGKLEIRFEDSTSLLQAGDLMTIPAGVCYRLVFDRCEVEYFIVNFDFTGNSFGTKAKTPVKKELFCASEIFSSDCPEGFDVPRVFTSVDFLYDAFEELERAYSSDKQGNESIRSALLHYIIGRLLLADGKENSKKNDNLSSRVKKYVKKHFHEHISNRSIASEMGYHPYYLSSCFLSSEGITLHAYIESVRLAHAKKLLLSTQAPIYEIAEACGFSEASYFVKFFVRHTKVTPKEFRKLSM